MCAVLRRLCHPFPFALALLCVVLPDAALPLSPSGEVVAVVQATTASGPGGNRTLGVEKPIYSGDKINTGAIGNAQLKFLDNTRFVIGPKSSVVIDRYVFNPDRTLAGASITMARGAFRFISGTGPKRAYRIKTPTATIGIRGTEVDVAVGRSLGTAVLVFKGAVRLCNNRSGQCKLVKAGCGAAVAKPAGEVWAPEEGRGTSQFINANFPLTRRQGRLPSAFRVSTQDCDQHSVTPRSPATRSQQASFTPDPVDPGDPGNPSPEGGGNDGGSIGSSGGGNGGGGNGDGGNDGSGNGGGGDGGGGDGGGGNGGGGNGGGDGR